MSRLIEENLSSVITPTDNKIKNLNLKTAYDYLNQISFAIDGTPNKTIELLSNDAVCVLGNSRMANLMLMKLAVHCLLPKKYGGLRTSKVFVLDAGNCTDVYQFIDFMKQFGLNIKKNLKKIMISRVFTVYQLTHFLKFELGKIINHYRINIVIIPDLLTMFFQEAEIDFGEVNFLVGEIIDMLKSITNEGKVLLLTSLAVDEQSHPLAVELGDKIVSCFGKSVAIDKNKTNNKFKILIRERQGPDYIAVKKYLSLASEDMLPVMER